MAWTNMRAWSLLTSLLLAGIVGSAPRLELSAAAGQPQPPIKEPRAADRFATVHGIRLQYVDWGGKGDVLLFLPGLGASVHMFDSFAPKFSTSFHVLGLTRRGQGLSDKPPSRYDTVTLAEDIKGFLDVMHIQRASLIAHSIGGIEMTRFASVYPTRVDKLVYLDAAEDSAQMLQLMADAGIPYPPYQSDAERQINTSQSHPDFTKVTAPALAYFVAFDPGYSLQSDEVLCPGCEPEVARNVRRLWRLMEEKNFWREQADRFRRDMKRGQVIELRGTNHFFFVDPKHTDGVVRQVKAFLLD
jgi:pimeloyl-ACP methyl ester carboxylesterase